MDQQSALALIDPAVWCFARRLRDDLGAERVLLFGSYARGTATSESDYDFIIVSSHFGSVDFFERTYGLHELFYDAGGYAPLDFICLTPEEFDAAKGRAT